MTVINAKRYKLLSFSLLLVGALMLGVPLKGQAVSDSVDNRSMAQLTYDDERNPLGYPAAVFYDPGQDELYVVNGGDGRIIVYGSDYFPRWSIGSGRGVFAPRGGTVLPDGRVLALQIRNRANPVAKITVLNGAFFPEQEIPLENLPGGEKFVPRKAVVSSRGLMYVAGDNYLGVLVLDDEGYLLRKLQPIDEISSYRLEREAKQEKEENTENKANEADEYANIPEEFRPRQDRGGRISAGSGEKSIGPVHVNYIATDSQGKFYLISPETGKIYVYDAEERFQFSFGTKGGSPGQLSNPRALVIDDKNGLIYVADYMRHTVLIYNLAGKYLFETGGRGTSPGWFNYPSDIALTSRGEIIVADLFNKRVQVLDVDYESRFYNLEDLLGADPEAAKEQELPSAGETTKADDATFDLLPGRPDIVYRDDEEGVEPRADGGETKADADSGVQVEIEILQDEDIPAASY